MSPTIEQTVVTVPAEAAPGDDVPRTEITVQYASPDGGEPLPVRITLFQLGHAIGVGVYPTEVNGTVLRWDDGIEADPRVIYWNAPHCRDDECGSPCGHETPGRDRPGAGEGR